MLSEVFVSQVSSEIASVREYRGINRRNLADRSDVGVRFLKNLEEGIVVKLNRIQQVQKLIRILMALSLSDTAESVKKEVKKAGRKARFRRMRFDKRVQVVLSKKGCRMR